MYGWVIAKNIDISFLDEPNTKQYFVDGYNIFVNVMNKFEKDTVFRFEEGKICLLDGVILNKKELLEEKRESIWQKLFEKLVLQENFPSVLRGCFNGVIYDRNKKVFTVYTNHVGDRPVYYYFHKDKMLISSNYNYMLKALKYNNISLTVDEMAVKCMLTYGYMLEDITFCKEIHRLLPGTKLNIIGNNADQYEIIRYYQISNKENLSITEDEAIELVDQSFRKAVKREFEKDKEYGYKHLVDLSGGLDSRMVSWVANDMGYKDQLNISYCKEGYYDEKISKEIAKYLNHEYMFKYLDDKKFLYDIEEITDKNFCAATYFGITGGNRLLQSLNMKVFGLEHTGQLGDALLSTYYQEKEENFSLPKFGEKGYSKYFECEFDESILKKHKNKEVFAIYERGFLGVCSTHFIRQNYTEVSSPFLDVDFMDMCLAIPFELRKNHNLYLKWIEKKYPDALHFVWEKTRVRMTKCWQIRSKIKMTGVKIKHIIEKYVMKKQYTDTMNPFEYWYSQDEKIREFLNTYYRENEEYLMKLEEDDRSQIQNMFEHSNAIDKMLVLTAIAGVKKIYVK